MRADPVNVVLSVKHFYASTALAVHWIEREYIINVYFLDSQRNGLTTWCSILKQYVLSINHIKIVLVLNFHWPLNFV